MFPVRLRFRHPAGRAGANATSSRYAGRNASRTPKIARACVAASTGLSPAGSCGHSDTRRSAIGRTTGAGVLHPVHRGVYAVGTRGSRTTDAARGGARCGGRPAQPFRGIVALGSLAEAPARIDVTVATRGHPRGSLRLHHAPAIADGDRAVREGVPVTAVPRTLLDLGQAAPRRLPRAIERASGWRLFDLTEVERITGGAAVATVDVATLVAAIARYRRAGFTRSG